MRILHVFRAPVGGLFRHVRDLARGQSALGHEVGLVCDAGTGGEVASQLLETAVPHCRLGIHRIDISRLPGIGDAKAVLKVRQLAKSSGAAVLHGHGAKGGLYARLAGRSMGMPAVYTPHGGSLHYNWSHVAGPAFLGSEWGLARIGTGVIFVCDYERRIFEAKLGVPRWPRIVVHNGLWQEEFSLENNASEASDFVFIGDLRPIKGVDILIDAVALLKARSRITVTLVGDGPHLAEYQDQTQRLGLSSNITFAGRLPTREALSLGRTLVLPSRAESFPYVVLEAAAQGKPVIASAVGGIPEVLPAECLTPVGDAPELAERLAANLADFTQARHAALALRDQLGTRFDAQQMAKKITEFYAVSAEALRSGTMR